MPDTLDDKLEVLRGEAKSARAEIAARLRQATGAEKERLAVLLSEIRRIEGDILSLRARFTAAELNGQANALARADLALHRESIARLLATLEPDAAPDGATDETPGEGPAIQPDPAEPNPARPAPSLSGRRIRISERELDLLSRVAHSEVGHFGKHGENQLKGGLAAVVDTIINGSMHKSFPSSLDAVVNSPKQFSAINDLGDWTRLPKATERNAKIVEAHLRARASGTPSAISGATHFLNPHFSSESALREWGNHVVTNAVAVFGNDAKKDVHFHGFAPNVGPPDSHTVEFAGESAGFTGRGTADLARTGSVADTVAVAEREWDFWGNSIDNRVTGERKRGNTEEDDAFAQYIIDTYCAVTGDKPSIGEIQDDENGFFWSAVTISFFMKQAGLSRGAFKFAKSHSVFIRDAIARRKAGDRSAAFWGFRLDEPEAVPRVGDLIACPRGPRMDDAEALKFFDKTTPYSSHSDLVVAVRPGEIDVIGGNVSESVTKKTLATDSEGKPVTTPRERWFVVLRRL